MGWERLRLPGGEPLGLLGLSTTTDQGPLYLGASFFGAAQGQRGGFFTFGLEGGLRARPSAGLPLEFEAGLFLGGGGGGSAPQGGGLMLRPHLDARLPLGPVRLGLGLSRVRFPNGQIDSRQVALSIAYTADRLWRPEGAWAAPYQGGLAWEPRSMELEWLRVTPRHGLMDRSGAPQGALDLAGFRLTRSLGGPWFRFLGMHGAVRGGSAGYAQVLGGAGFRVPLVGPLELEASLGLGLGGGGNLEARGGLLGHAEALVTGGSTTWRAGAGLGYLRMAEGGFRGRTLTLRVAHRFEAGLPGTGPVLPVGETSDWRVGAAFLAYGRAARTDGTHEPLRLLALGVERRLTDSWYLRGEAGTATSGGAGGYATGLVGLGGQTPAWHRQRAFLEAAVGAGGGGGVATGGGLLTSLRGGWRLDLARGVGFTASLGRVWAPRGHLEGTTFALGFDLAFGAPTR